MPLRLLEPSKGYFLPGVESTNDAIRAHQYEPGSWILADTQSSGRGRSGKKWIVSGEENIIFSGKNQVGLTGFPVTLLSLFSSSSLLKAILEWYPDLEGVCLIKWPNDIFKLNKKVAGILIESEITNDQFQIIVGFGLNIYGEFIANEISNIACYLLDTKPLEGSRERILYSFIKYWNESLLRIAGGSGIDREIQWIESNSLLVGKEIQYTIDGTLHRGNVLGYDQNGFLITHEGNGRKYTLMDTDPSFGIVA